MNPAFELLRKHKKVSEETESLVMKRISGKVSQNELITIFEKGITGEYGKFIVADPQTILGWINEHQKGKTTAKNYLASGLLPVTTPAWEAVDWMKEANKCYVAFLSGVSSDNFHPSVYDRMMIDGKIQLNACMKFCKAEDDENEVRKAKQKVLSNVFNHYKKSGYNTVYFIS